MQGQIFNDEAEITKVWTMRECSCEPAHLDCLISVSNVFKKYIFYEDIHWPAVSFHVKRNQKIFGSGGLANGEQLSRPSLVSAWHRRWSFSLQLRGTRAGKVSRESWLPRPRRWKLHDISRILLIHQVKSLRNIYVSPNQPSLWTTEPARTCNLLVCLWPEQICKQSRSLLSWAALEVSYARSFQLLHIWSSEHQTKPRGLIATWPDTKPLKITINNDYVFRATQPGDARGGCFWDCWSVTPPPEIIPAASWNAQDGYPPTWKVTFFRAKVC